MKNFLLSFLLGALLLPAYAQNDSIHVLDQVVLHSSQLEEFSNSQHIQTFNDSVVKSASSSLTDVLRFRTPIYFKENGLGMVSSASFRGTTASQTAVVWNGININSKFNGQTDFNAINISGYDAVTVRSGGGSILYGTGAIGGSVHLNNDFQFGQGVKNELKLGYGSFNTLDARYGVSYSNKKTNVQIHVARTSSDNDYKHVGSDRKNLNGQYYNTSVKTNVAYRISPRHLLKFHTSLFDGESHFSLIRPTENRTKYQNFHAWNLVAWETGFHQFSSELKVAHLNESFKYYRDIEEDGHTNGNADTFIVSYNLGYDFKNGMEIHGLFDYSNTKGKGTNIPENSQKKGTSAILIKHEVSRRLLYELGIRKEFADDYKSPFLFSAGMVFKANDFYSLKLNASKNYRIPTFNDLYWERSGNTDLKPETSSQGEVGNYFQLEEFDFSFTGYFISIKDMIYWVPSGNGIWRPENTSKVQSYGVESNLGYQKNSGNHHFSLQATYGYTVSENKTTGKQLIYVPFHKATLGLGYGFMRWELSYNFLYNGEVFTRTDNDSSYNLPAYQVSNLNVSYNFGRAHV